MSPKNGADRLYEPSSNAPTHPIVFVTYPKGLRTTQRDAVRQTVLRAYPGARFRFAWECERNYAHDSDALNRAIATSNVFVFACGRHGWIGRGVVGELQLARALGKPCYAVDLGSRTLHADVFVAERAGPDARPSRVVRLAFREPHADAPVMIVNPVLRQLSSAGGAR